MIRVLLADDHSALLESVEFMINREPDIDVVATAGSVAEAKTKTSEIDIAVVDLHLPDGDGVELTKYLRESNRDAAVIILSASNNRSDVARAVEAGASAFLHKSSSISEITSAIRKVYQGEPLFSVDEIMKLFRLAGQEKEERHQANIAIARLTRRELELLQELSRGYSLKEIAENFEISFETTRTHMVNILTKLNLHSQMQALIFAIRYGLVEIE